MVLGAWAFFADSEEPTITPTTTTVETTKSATVLASTVKSSESVNTTPAETQEKYIPSEEDVEYIAKTLWGEARGIESDMEKAAVAWCILNRVDCDRWADTVEGVVTQPSQFHGYAEHYPVTDELRAIAEDVLIRWHNEKVTGEVDGRVLPPDYYFFYAIGDRNYFRQEYEDREYWDWSMENPYED